MKEEILDKFEKKFVADDIFDCIPKKNWEEMKDEVWAFIKECADWKIKELVENSHCDVICECGEVHTFEKYLRQILSNKDKVK